jgi:transcription elongation factor GreB
MSKAFTRESDLPDPPLVAPMPSLLPPGVKNYITPGGIERLREEVARLTAERAQFAAQPEANRSQLQALDQRLAALNQSLQSAVVVEVPAAPDGTVRFGATVSVRDRGGTESQYRIVGVDEVDLDRDWVSWRSPIAAALLNKKVGERVRVRLPMGEEELEILSITYE